MNESISMNGVQRGANRGLPLEISDQEECPVDSVYQSESWPSSRWMGYHLNDDRSAGQAIFIFELIFT